MIHESLWNVYTLTPSSAVTKPVVGVFDLASNVSEGAVTDKKAFLGVHY